MKGYHSRSVLLLKDVLGVRLVAAEVFSPTSNFITSVELWMEWNFCASCWIHFLHPRDDCDACNLWAGCNYRVLEGAEICDIGEHCINSDQNLTSCTEVQCAIMMTPDLTLVCRDQNGGIHLKLQRWTRIPFCRAIRRICLLLHTKTVLMPHQ